MPSMQTTGDRARFVILLCASALCGLFLGCDGSSWQDVKPHHTSANPPARYRFGMEASGTLHDLHSIYGRSDGTEMWAAGREGTILHYSKDAGKWETQDSGTSARLESVYGTADGAQVWAVGGGGTTLHYSKDTGKWEMQTSGTPYTLNSIYGTSDGAQLWAVGPVGTIPHYSKDAGKWETQDIARETPDIDTSSGLESIYGTSDGVQLWVVGEGGRILHYSKAAGKWETQDSGITEPLYSIYATSDGAQLWAVGRNGTILRYSKAAGKWETQDSGTSEVLLSMYGTSDGAQLWTVGIDGTLLHFSKDTGKWEKQISGTTESLHSIHGTSDGTQLWAVGERGTILHAKLDGFYAYLKEARLLPRLGGAELQVRIVEDPRATDLPVELDLYGSNGHNFKANIPSEKINAKVGRPHTAGEDWVFDFDPADIGVSRGEVAYLQIELKQGDYSQDYRAPLKYDPLPLIREHWLLSLVLFLAALFVATLTLLLFTRPLWNLYLYRKLKIYQIVEQMDLPGVGKILQLVLKLTILPWFVTHRRTLRAWVIANRTAAGNAWDATFRLTTADLGEQKRLDLPYVPLPLVVEDSGPRRSLPQPMPEDFDSLLKGKRSVIQVIGQGGGGKTTLARHIGGLALAGGEAGGVEGLPASGVGG